MKKFEARRGKVKSSYFNKLAGLNSKIKLYNDFEEGCKRKFKLNENIEEMIKESEYISNMVSKRH